VVEGRALRYVDWLLPGLLAVNMMFSCLFGVGYVIVRYHKIGVLRRFKATPLSAFEFLAAQVGSRFLLVMAVTIIIYIGTDVFLDFLMLGSYALLFLVFTAGALCLIALGLLFAARTASEELAGGLLNLVSWPMMLLSGAWFSLEGTPGWIQMLFPGLPPDAPHRGRTRHHDRRGGTHRDSPAARHALGPGTGLSRHRFGDLPLGVIALRPAR
jgi:ABC-type multidrug transport system permease subunit